jgi:curli biogenesis system outer membrane secretion channel CsgG
MKRVVSVLSAALVLHASSAFALWGKAETKTASGNADLKLGEYKGLKHAIGCKGFNNESGWAGEWKIGDNLTALLESALVDSGRFVLVEREKLGDVLLEQDLQASGRAAKAKDAAKTGMIRSARYLATGSVTEVTENQSGADGGIRIKGIRLGGGRSEAQVTVIVKLIDTTTSEIVAKERVVGKAGNTGLRVGVDIGSVGTELGGFKKTPLGQAAQDCINQAAAFIAKKMEAFPFEGSVVKVAESGQVIINRGTQFGVEVGQALVMGTLGTTLMDPDTGEVLGKEEGKVIGKLKVTKTLEKMSYCDVTEGEKAPPAGTVVSAK